MSHLQNVASIYGRWLEAVNHRDWVSASNQIASELIRNDETISSIAFLQGLQKRTEAIPDIKTEIFMVVADKTSGKIASIITHRGTLVKPYKGFEVTREQIEWSEYVFCEFKNEKMDSYTSLSDCDTAGISSAHMSNPPISNRVINQKCDLGLEILYQQYIHAINTLTMAEHFPSYCQSQVVHNGRHLSMDEYRGLIESSFEEIQGLRFTIANLVADEEAQRIAARLEFSGRPVTEFRGIQPTGKEVNFSEHVLYELDDGKIARVWSVLDLDAYRTSLEN
ncbi:SnoaL-like polyketide cyclase-domain-containing protein [Ilyonectria destructans]|nr:SnoaL-like polyketide cyclase-domain-containing protein [Ilyonectria destructans]